MEKDQADSVNLLWTQCKHAKFHEGQLRPRAPVQPRALAVGEQRIELSPEFLMRQVRAAKEGQFTVIAEPSELQSHNHVRQNHLLGNKRSMYQQVASYCAREGKDIEEYVPVTFVVLSTREAAFA